MKSIKKFDAIPKLKGSWKFLDDYTYDGMLHGQLLYSTCHHGIIKKIKFPTGFDLNEFTLVSSKDIPGTNIVPEPEPDQPYMADEEVFHFGQVIMGIANPSKEVLLNFMKQIRIDYEELPAITGVEECLENEANAFGREIVIDHRRDIEPEADWIHSHETYYTAHQEQAYLEPQGMISIWKPDEKIMFVKATCQCPYFVKHGVETIMGDTIKEAVVETSEGIGGAFGGKEDFPSLLAGISSLLAYKSGKPVKIVLDRSDDIQITTKRHPSRVELDTYTDPETGKIMKLNIDYRLDAGYYQTLSPVVLARGVLHALGGYNIPDVYILGRLFRSNTPSNGAFRGFGAPQAFAAIEAHADKIAAQLDLDPFDFRKTNILKIGNEFPTTQKVTEGHLEDCLDRVIEKSEYKRKVAEFKEWNTTHKDKKGIGISMGYHGGGYTGNGEKVLNSEVKVVIEKDANVKIFVANTDMGQGAHTSLAQMFFEAIGHPREKCWVQLPNTSKTPNSGPTVASRTIYIIGNLLKKFALKIKAELEFNNLEEYVKVNQDEFPREFRMNFVPDPSVDFDDKTYQGTAYKDYSWAACVSEIYFHADTYKIDLKKFWHVFDIGRTVNPKIAMGQAEGGVIQAMGYALTEFFYKDGFGRMNGFTDYVLPISVDIPEIDIEFIHTDSEIAKGLGEIPMDYPAPAIRNAFYNASGIFINEYPLIPERIYEYMQKIESNKE
jgi:CO/xanthine dehydrogenase Mo-binding subunit